jgi:serine/threonine protein kinase
LKLGNIIYDLKSQKVYLINFSLSRHLNDSNELLTEHIGSPAYISPEILNKKPYCGKSSDIWSLGVVLYTILFGHFPFYDPITEKLFEKIKLGNYTFPEYVLINADSKNDLLFYVSFWNKRYIKVSESTKSLLKNLLEIDPNKRFNAKQAINSIMSILSSHSFESVSICENLKTLQNDSKKQKGLFKFYFHKKSQIQALGK